MYGAARARGSTERRSTSFPYALRILKLNRRWNLQRVSRAVDFVALARNEVRF